MAGLAWKPGGSCENSDEFAGAAGLAWPDDGGHSTNGGWRTWWRTERYDQAAWAARSEWPWGSAESAARSEPREGPGAPGEGRDERPGLAVRSGRYGAWGPERAVQGVDSAERAARGTGSAERAVRGVGNAEGVARGLRLRPPGPED